MSSCDDLTVSLLRDRQRVLEFRGVDLGGGGTAPVEARVGPAARQVALDGDRRGRGGGRGCLRAACQTHAQRDKQDSQAPKRVAVHFDSFRKRSLVQTRNLRALQSPE